MRVEDIAGTWVRSEDMFPETNIAGREWITADGEMSGVGGCGLPIPLEAHRRGILWHFPDHAKRKPAPRRLGMLARVKRAISSATS